MIAQYANNVMSSIYFWLDNKILTSGVAYTNVSTLFYPVMSEYYGYYTYSSPYSQIVSDFSVPGANILTGVYVGSNLYSTGYGGLAQINYDKGDVYFTGAQTLTISGNYAIKDFNIELTTQPESVLITETKYSARSKIPRNPTGIQYNETTYPIIYIKNNGGENKPFSLGGMDTSDFDIRLIILSDSQFKLDAVTSIIKDTQKTPIAYLEGSNMPFNAFGGYKTINYNYTGISKPILANQQFLFVDRVYISKYTESIKADIKSLNSEIFVAFADMEISQQRQIR